MLVPLNTMESKDYESWASLMEEALSDSERYSWLLDEEELVDAQDFAYDETVDVLGYSDVYLGGELHQALRDAAKGDPDAMARLWADVLAESGVAHRGALGIGASFTFEAAVGGEVLEITVAAERAATLFFLKEEA